MLKYAKNEFMYYQILLKKQFSPYAIISNVNHDNYSSHELIRSLCIQII